MSIAVWLPRPGQCFPPGKPAAQQKSHSYFTRWSDQNQESLNFIEKNLDLPLYKIEISGIIIIVRCASVAQLVEQGTENPRVIGSIPIGGTTSRKPVRVSQYAAVAHLVERHLAKVEVASSSLVGRSITEQQKLLQYGPVAQLVRAPACHAGGRRFEPDPGRFVGMSVVCLAVLQVRPP